MVSETRQAGHIRDKLYRCLATSARRGGVVYPPPGGTSEGVRGGARMKRPLIAAAAVIALAGLPACETATPSQPVRPGAAQAGGYSELKIEQDRWRITFRGNDMTSRETVETYLLYRAAELTVSQGDDWFETVDRQTDKHSQTQVDPIGPY